MRNINKFIATIGIVTITATSLTGCGDTNSDITKYPLVPALTEQEVIDFYSEALKYDAVVTKNIDVHETTYVEKEIDGDKRTKLEGLYSKAEELLYNMDYKYSKENSKVLSEDTFHYIKSYLNGNKLSNAEIKSVTGALGYYFVDVEYDITPRTIGTFTQKTSLLGINGAFVRNPLGGDEIDSAFLTSAARKLDSYYKDNRINKTVSFDAYTGVLTETDIADEIYTDYDIYTEYNEIDEEQNLLEEDIPQTGLTTLTNVENMNDLDESIDNLDENTDSLDESTDNLEENITNYETTISSSRECNIDVETFNTIVGSSNKEAAYMPETSQVFNVPVPEGTVGGIGIYPSGANGLALFGYDRSQINGKLTFRYVFKDTVDGSGDIIGVNVYPKSEKISTGFTTTDSNVIIPEFLLREFEQLLERADRANISFILPALIGGHIYEDMGFAVLRGYEYNHVNLLKQMSTIRQVIARDDVNNSYLLEIETTRIEGPKDVDCYGTYRDKSYVVVKQKGDEFIITDQIRISRQLVTEPSINPDSSIQKRLIALNLSGEIQEAQKQDIEKLLTDWYNSGTYRILNGPKDITYNGKNITVERGMYDCFNSDVTMLSTDEKEYMNSEVRGLLIKYGADKQSTYIGTVTEWMGGYENQAEFTTEELIIYEGKKEAKYMQVYYLVSHMGQEWVIDERTVLDEKTVNGNDLETIKSRISK